MNQWANRQIRKMYDWSENVLFYETSVIKHVALAPIALTVMFSIMVAASMVKD